MASSCQLKTMQIRYLKNAELLRQNVTWKKLFYILCTIFISSNFELHLYDPITPYILLSFSNHCYWNIVTSVGTRLQAKCCLLFFIRSIRFNTSIQRGIFSSKISHVYFVWIYSFERNPSVNKCNSSVFTWKYSKKARKRQANFFDTFFFYPWRGKFLIFISAYQSIAIGRS